MRFNFYPKPDNCESYKDTLFFVKELTGKYPVLRCWSGKQSKPYINKLFATIQKLEDCLQSQKNSVDIHLKFKEEQKQSRIQGKSDFLANLKVGDIFYNSWGYDQTNIDFYQVIDIKGSKITLQSISGKSVPGTQGHMCENVSPVKDSFVGQPFTKIVSGNGIAMRHGCMSKTTETSSHYSSWYA